MPQGAQEHLPRIRALCEPHLQWGGARWDEEIARYQALIQAHYALPAM